MCQACLAPEALSARLEVLETRQRRLLRLRLQEERCLVSLYLPLLVQDRLIGVLEAYGPDALAEEGAETLYSLSSQAASALENARLYTELAERENQLRELVGRLITAQEEERRRVAYDVHDGLAQTAAAHQHLQAYARHHSPASKDGREELDETLNLVSEASNGLQAIEMCRLLEPDLILMDVRMPEMDGITATRRIKNERPGVGVLMVTMHENPDYLLEALDAGAAGYVLKDAPANRLISAVHRTLNGESPLNQELATLLLRRLADEKLRMPHADASKNNVPSIGALTPRETSSLRSLQQDRQTSRSPSRSTSAKARRRCTWNVSSASWRSPTVPRRPCAP